jgi:diacylglycerol kinase family enzyme
MYLYLYDDHLRQKKYDTVVKSIETRLTDFGIAGKIIRLQPFTNAHAVIEEEMSKGIKTVVIVGNDQTFGHVLSRAATCKILFGFLPVGPGNTIADVLGIPEGIEGCDVLSRRRKVKLDVGWVNNRYFVSQLHIFPHNIQVTYDERFSVSSANQKMELVVCNLQPFVWKGRGKKEHVIHPQDGKLEAFLRPMERKGVIKEVYEDPSVFPFEEMIVASDTPFEMVADGKTTKEVKVTIRLAKKRIEMIVGRERQF